MYKGFGGQKFCQAVTNKNKLVRGGYILIQKFLVIKNFMGQTFYGFQYLGAQTFWGPSCFGGKEIFGIKILG